MTSDTYHHGDLANVLVRTAADLLAERGAAGFSLREVTRRAGVSHTAPVHHFGDARGLLTAVAVEAFRHLTAETEAAIAGIDDPAEALARLGRAYVSVAVEHPGHCAVIFRDDVVDADDAEYEVWGQRAHGVLVGVVQRLADAANPDLDVDLAVALCWSTMQGLIELHGPMARLAEHSGATVPPIGDMAEGFSRLVVTGFTGRPGPG